MINIRNYHWQDCDEIIQMFKDTILHVNCRDYDADQLQAWINGADLGGWHQSLMEHKTLVAVENNKIVGFADMDHSGFLDRLYVHKDYQHQHIATMLCTELEAWAYQQGVKTI